ncbi:5-formyltetrahydrofolate cyclo-ligase [Sinirhodobacter populi]|uniref:5-formyltetrahydrofolate cyclo-ligase n=1 Tax=Paenirhodobacter populi TaxID=2306993 RepID=A0A443KIU1_9RHOB|nr:5-formyltetrahydrofolate cyclo-ligase [Sinirhodobacter populi]RWR32683.1 5-formyltetrahydrofolate cyclo-ligase [Sinirhodobacter populi]
MTKEAARRAAFAARRAAHETGRGDAACDYLTRVLRDFGPVPLAGYMPIRTELDPRPAMAAHPGLVAVPVVTGPGAPLVFHRWHPDMPMLPGAFGAPVPQTAEELVPRVLIVPLLAFDRRGFRLGYGGGFYDRTLEDLRRAGPVTAIGFAFAAQEIAEVPTEPTDQPLDLIVTEQGVILPAQA